MHQLTPGKTRGLDTLATNEGVFTILAIDHRDSLKAVLPGEATDQEIIDFKLELISGVGPQASGVMLEPEFSLPHAIEAGAHKQQIIETIGQMALFAGIPAMQRATEIAQPVLDEMTAAAEAAKKEEGDA